MIGWIRNKHARLSYGTITMTLKSWIEIIPNNHTLYWVLLRHCQTRTARNLNKIRDRSRNTCITVLLYFCQPHLCFVYSLMSVLEIETCILMREKWRRILHYIQTRIIGWVTTIQEYLDKERRKPIEIKTTHSALAIYNDHPTHLKYWIAIRRGSRRNNKQL